MRAKKRMLAVGLLAAAPALAQFSYPGCPAVAQSDFVAVPLITNQTDATMREPLKMALLQNAAGNVDVYFVQRYGLLRKYDGTAKTTATLFDFKYGLDSIADGFSEGLLGIALDPGFPANGWIYLYSALRGNWKISRYTLKGNALDRATEKSILRFTAASWSQHMGSALRFDEEGNLWITVADNGGATSPGSGAAVNLYQAANTNSYFGKILRIKPKPIPDNQSAPAPGLGSTYDVPTGNLFAQGTAKTLPEIYVMGTRNPYSLNFDPVRKAVAWGDVGPDNFPGATDSAQWTEEFNFTTKPGFFGWPYWAGNNYNLPTQALPAGSTAANPVNDRADNTGLANLPPATIPLIRYVKNCALAGPVYYYDGASPSKVKFPPHFNGAWFVGDFNQTWIDAVGLNAAGSAMTGRMRVVTIASSQNVLNDILEIQMGPDGAMYVVNYSGYRTFDSKTGIVRIEYRGACQPTSLFPEAQRLKPAAAFDGALLAVAHAGRHTVEVRDASGRLEWARRGDGPARYDLRSLQKPGLHFLRVATADQTRDFKFVR